jgi:hypothetical protein
MNKAMKSGKCGMWAYADGHTHVCTEGDNHQGQHHDPQTRFSWSTPFAPPLTTTARR